MKEEDCKIIMNDYENMRQTDIFENKFKYQSHLEKAIIDKNKFIYFFEIIFLILFVIVVFLDMTTFFGLNNEKIKNIKSKEKAYLFTLNNKEIIEPPREIDPGVYTPIKKKDYTDYYRLKEIAKVKIIETNKLPFSSAKDKININIAYGLNNGPVYPVLVSMTSIMENLDKKRTIVTFYLLLSPDFKKENIDKLKTILKNYPNNCELVLYNMTNVFDSIKKFKGGHANYYRLLLADMLTDINKIIYLDSDTLAFKDITEMYLIDSEKNYMMGFPDFWAFGVDYLGAHSKTYLCSGVLLFNLKKIRDDQKTKELIQFTITRDKYIRYYDQNILNYIFFPNVAPLPFKYGIFNFHKKEFIDTEYLPKLRYKPNVTELYEAMRDPSLVHYTLCNPKIYQPGTKYSDKTSCVNYQKKFYYYANKTDFYNEIYNLYMNNK